jgi:hypothetical protein
MTINTTEFEVSRYEDTCIIHGNNESHGQREWGVYLRTRICMECSSKTIPP